MRVELVDGIESIQFELSRERLELSILIKNLFDDCENSNEVQLRCHQSIFEFVKDYWSQVEIEYLSLIQEDIAYISEFSEVEKLLSRKYNSISEIAIHIIDFGSYVNFDRIIEFGCVSLNKFIFITEQEEMTKKLNLDNLRRISGEKEKKIVSILNESSKKIQNPF